MKQIAVVSGKGGTGKTSMLLAFARIARNIVLADCDVDASNLPVTLQPTPVKSKDIIGAHKASIDPERCVACGLCAEKCRFGAIDAGCRVTPLKCEGCGVCEFVCPQQAVTLHPVVSGTLQEAATEAGTLVYMDMVPGEEGTGKLVTAVRNRAKELAEEHGTSLVLIDGSPGIGCPVIATIGAVDMALVVTEPSLSGMGDLQRIAELSASMGVPCCVCVNRYDINTGITDQIGEYCASRSIPVIGKIPYNPQLARSIELRQDIPEAARDDWALIESLWHTLCELV